MDTPERRQQQRLYYLRMRNDPAKVESYRERKREWARRAAAARRVERQAVETLPAREA